MPKIKSGSGIRKEFIEFFEKRGHKFVPSSSLVPGGDQTLLFTNAGMVQFKDVFLGTDKRDYARAVNSQKCMRVAGKHNDLDDVGRDDLHHTFFEMLGNWSFGDYYKPEAISWAWELLTEKWGLDKNRLWVTYFKDELGEIETDDEAAENWLKQPGIVPSQILPFGRKDNFWEMADTGPCGPCSEIHYDKGAEYCDKQDDPTHKCGVNSDCHRYLELWNLVFIQYNRTSPTNLDPLPARHVDTGMGFERIVSVMQGVDSNYRTDLLMPLIEEVMKLTGDDERARDDNFTPYRVIADHARAASFLIADGVVPGNVGRNYICRMIIRRASRFGTKLGLNEPFLAKVAEQVINNYGSAYLELEKNRKTILDNITREEERFQNTVERGLAFLNEEIDRLMKQDAKLLDGQIAFDLYATHGLPLEITRDVLRERGLEADAQGFFAAMEEHRVNSGAGKEFGAMGGEDAEIYTSILTKLKSEGLIRESGVEYDPYRLTSAKTQLAAILSGGKEVKTLQSGKSGELIIDRTGFYIEAGGQVSDTGRIVSDDGKSVFIVEDVRKPAPGMITHIGKVVEGEFIPGMSVIAEVDIVRRQDIMRNHTATHLLHAELREILGEHVRQAGSLVAPDRLRFDFTHPKAMSREEIKKVEGAVNTRVLNNYTLNIREKKLSQALEEGAMALFGEKYGEDVRTITIGDEVPFSYELCGGTHVNETAEIGTFFITSEGSAAAGIRRIEAITGRKAYELIRRREKTLEEIKDILESSSDELVSAVKKLVMIKEEYEKQHKLNSSQSALSSYKEAKESLKDIQGKKVLWLKLENSSPDILRNLADQFRKDFPSGIAIFVNITNGNVQIVSAVTEDLVKEKVSAGDIVKKISKALGGSGGGRPELAQGGGKDSGMLSEIEINLTEYL
jgi:alanyl-tRNA synthetase